MEITACYAAVMAIFFVLLSVRVIKLRNTLKVGFGDGGDKRLKRAVRVHANYAEYTPLALLLIAFAEQASGSSWWIHALAVALLVGRLSHAYGVSQMKENFTFRVFGMGTTFAVLLAAAVTILIH